MITLEDCIAFCSLSEEEILAIAEHEHVPEIAAVALAEYLLHQEHGPEKIADMIRDDVWCALERKDFNHARVLFSALRHFLGQYPEAMMDGHLLGGRHHIAARAAAMTRSREQA